MRLFIIFIMLLFASNTFAVESRIYAQRVSTSGTAVGSPIVLNSGTTGQPQSEPSVAFFDDRFLVVYQEWNGSDLDVKAVRLSMDGTVLDPTPLTIKSGVKTQGMPSVAADTTGWMVVWQGWATGSHFPSIYANRVNYDGTLGSTEISFGDGDDLGSNPQIAYNSTEDTFGVVYTGSNHDRVSYKKTQVTVLSTTPVVSSAGTDYIIAEQQSPVFHAIAGIPSGGWTFTQSGQIATIYTTRLAQAAVAIATDGSFAAGNYMSSGEKIYTQHGDDNTVFMDNNGTSGTSTETQHAYGFNAITMDSTYAIAAWERWTLDSNFNKRYVDCSIYAGRLDDYDLVESVGGTAIVTGGSGVSYEKPALASNGLGTVLITYNKTTDGEMEIGSKLLTISGSVSPGSEVILRDTTNGTRRTHPDVAYGDDEVATQEFMVVWTEGWWGTL